jgi:hypothetical protein
MEIIFMFVAGFIVFLIALIAIFRSAVFRMKEPAKQNEERISQLEKRLEKLETRK